MESYIKLLNKASKLHIKEDTLLQKALKIVLESKDIHLDGFFICRTSENETVVHYNNDEGCKYQLSDLDLSIMASMTKQEIYDYFGIKER